MYLVTKIKFIYLCKQFFIFIHYLRYTQLRFFIIERSRVGLWGGVRGEIWETMTAHLVDEVLNRQNKTTWFRNAL